VSLDHVSIRGIPSETHAGVGVSALSSRLALTDFEVRNAQTCGIFLSLARDSRAPPEVDLIRGEVSGSMIGACVQIDGYALERLTEDVDCVDNGVNLDSTGLRCPRSRNRWSEECDDEEAWARQLAKRMGCIRAQPAGRHRRAVSDSTVRSRKTPVVHPDHMMYASFHDRL